MASGAARQADLARHTEWQGHKDADCTDADMTEHDRAGKGRIGAGVACMVEREVAPGARTPVKAHADLHVEPGMGSWTCVLPNMQATPCLLT